MSSVNKVFILGHAGNDPECGITKNGKSFSMFNVATEDIQKNERGIIEKTPCWHRVNFYGNIADVANEYVKKGTKVFVEGKISYNKVEPKEKNSKAVTYTNIIGKNLTLLGKPNNENASGPNKFSERPL